MNSWKDIQGIVPAPGEEPDFEACLEAFPLLEHAKTTPQDPIYHGEGDVWTHTKMVMRELVNASDYAALPLVDRETVYIAAALHDVTKFSTTVVDQATGRVGQPGHSKKGAIDARVMLWDLDTPFEQREAICRLISVHQVPFYAMEHSRKGTAPEFVVRHLSWQMNLRLLSLLAEADMRGRICPDRQKVLDSVELFREMAREEGCYEGPRAFADPHTAVSYFRGANVHPDYALFQDSGSKVIVMSGLPASGKNTWVEHNHPGLTVVSFDDARKELGLKHGKNEGAVAHHAVDQAKALLRAKRPFVWNATHLSDQMRAKTLDLCFAYKAEIDIVYVESTRSELMNRNHKRDTSLSNQGILSMLHRWEVPLPTEAHSVRCLSTGLKIKKALQP